MRAETSQQEADRMLAEDRARRAVRVDHRAPIHDRLCRCRDCKPSFTRKRPTMPIHLAVGLALWVALVLIARAAL